MEKSILVAGFGGQGVLSTGKLLCYAAVDNGMNATFFPTYGGEQRGGTANCAVILSDDEIASPVVRQADIVIVLNEPSFEKFENRVKSGGLLIVNTSNVKLKTGRTDIKVVEVEADRLAMEENNPKASNMAAFGAFQKATGLFSKEQCIDTIRVRMAYKPKHLDSNIRVFEKAAE